MYLQKEVGGMTCAYNVYCVFPTPHPHPKKMDIFGACTLCRTGFGGLGVSVLAFGTQVRGFKPGRSRRIFKGEKILSTPSFRGEVKPSVPCRRFAACKRFLELCGSPILGQICRIISRPQRVPPSATRVRSRRWT